MDSLMPLLLGKSLGKVRNYVSGLIHAAIVDDDQFIYQVDNGVDRPLEEFDLIPDAHHCRNFLAAENPLQSRTVSQLYAATQQYDYY